MAIDQNEHILSQQYLRRNNIYDLGWEKESSCYKISFACVITVMLVETNSFFGSFNDFETHQLCKLISIRMSKRILSKSCKGAPKVAPIFCDLGWKKRKVVLIDFASQMY